MGQRRIEFVDERIRNYSVGEKFDCQAQPEKIVTCVLVNHFIAQEEFSRQPLYQNVWFTWLCYCQTIEVDVPLHH